MSDDGTLSPNIQGPDTNVPIAIINPAGLSYGLVVNIFERDPEILTKPIARGREHRSHLPGVALLGGGSVIPFSNRDLLYEFEPPLRPKTM